MRLALRSVRSSDRLPSGQICDGARLQRLFRIEHERQHFVVDGDQPQRLFGDVAIDGGDGRHRLADEAHRIVERVAALLGDLLDLVVVLPAAGDRARAPDDRAVLVREHRLDAGQRQRLRGVDRCGCGRADAGCAARARTACPGSADVAGVGGLAGDALDARRCAGSRGRRSSALDVVRRAASSIIAICRAPAPVPAAAASVAST